jgi:RNA polymerase sigma factor (sigma-70 family)
VSDEQTIEGLLRELAPQALAVLARRSGSFADAEDAVQEALIKAYQTWRDSDLPERPLAWLVRVASRQLIGDYRSDTARRRREYLAASWQQVTGEPVPGRDDSLTLLFMCCHDALTPAAAIPLTLRALGGLTTRELADAFLVKEATMGQRISRAKATIRAAPEPFALPTADAYDRRLRSVLHVLYLMSNEGHVATRGAELGRPDLAVEAIRLTRMAHALRPDDAEIAGLLGLLLLTEARPPLAPVRTANSSRSTSRTEADGTMRSFARVSRSSPPRSAGTGPGRTCCRPPSPRCTTRHPTTPIPTGPRSHHCTGRSSVSPQTLL